MARFRIFVLIFLALLVTLACGVLPVAPEGADPEAEYYRGLYDTCMQLLLSPSICMKNVMDAYENDWYGQPSRGWEWPLPELVIRDRMS